MKSKFFIVVITIILLAGCKSQESVSTNFISEDLTYIHDKLTPVVLSKDSAYIRAIFECDSNLNVVLKELKAVKSSNIQASFDYTGGILNYNLYTGGDTVYVRGRDTYKRINTHTYTTRTITKIKTIGVEKKTSWLDNLLIKFGKLFVVFVLLTIIYIIIKFRIKNVLKLFGD